MNSEANTMNTLELTSVLALIAYTAHQYHVSDETIREMVTTRFGIKEVTQLPRASFDDTIRFLVNVQVDLLLN